MRNLESITIEGFRSFQQERVELRALNLLIGANGSGKSNLLEAFEMLGALGAGDLSVWTARNGFADSILRFGAKHTSSLALGLSFRANHLAGGYHASLAAGQDGHFVFEVEDLSADGVTHRITRDGRQTGLRDSDHPAAQWLRTESPQWRRYHFADTTRTAPMKNLIAVDDNFFLHPDGANLAAFLYRIERQSPRHFREINETIRLAAPYFGSFRLEPDRNNRLFIRLEWRERDRDHYMSAHQLSDGTLRFICLVTLLLQPVLPSLLLIDEPELGLHPAAIEIFADLLKEASSRTQLLVATQSPTLLDYCEADDIIVAERTSGPNKLKRLDSQELSHWRDEYTLGQLWNKNLLGGRP